MKKLDTLLAEKLLQINAVKLQPDSPFTWATGWQSPVYTDLRMTLSYPEVRNLIKVEMARLIMENFGALPSGKLILENHGLIVICTKGHAQFEYDGRLIQLEKNDLFLYMAHSIADRFLASSDFNCRQIWFSRSELWSINMYGQVSLADLDYLHHEPKVHLNDDDVTLLDTNRHID